MPVAHQLLQDWSWAIQAFPALVGLPDPGSVVGWEAWLEAMIDKQQWKYLPKESNFSASMGIRILPPVG